MNDPDAMPSLLAVFINWLPTIILAVIWLVFMRRSLALQRAGNEELRRSANALEQVAATLEKRS
jgi:ATP-dependent Zn protease